MDKLTDPLTFETKTFNQIFGTLGSGPDDIIPTSFELYFNKSNDNFALTVYIDNIRFGTSVPADYNGNDVVDAADYVLWRKTIGPTPPNFRNEVASLGTIDAADYTAWRQRFGSTMPDMGSGSLVSGAVPEPGTVWLMLVSGGICCVARGQRKTRRS